MNNSTHKLFVYGSLRSGFHNPAYQYLTKYFRLLGEAVVKGKLYDNGSYPVAIPTTDDFYINGELYESNSPDEFPWAIEQLDDYEGLNVEAGDFPRYRRELTKAYQVGKPVDAWVYWFNGNVEGMKEITVGDVLLYLQKQNKP
jgi:gamma-glutamylcyclotransferase (GGCT)/AIG2-like uncharacterized protein YtfP